MLKDFSRSSSSASSFASVVEETEGVDGDDTGLVSRPRGSPEARRTPLVLSRRSGSKHESGCVAEM